jgi:hypothetical protein
MDSIQPSAARLGAFEDLQAAYFRDQHQLSALKQGQATKTPMAIEALKNETAALPEMPICADDKLQIPTVEQQLAKLQREFQILETTVVQQAYTITRLMRALNRYEAVSAATNNPSEQEAEPSLMNDDDVQTLCAYGKLRIRTFQDQIAKILTP